MVCKCGLVVCKCGLVVCKLGLVVCKLGLVVCKLGLVVCKLGLVVCKLGLLSFVGMVSELGLVVSRLGPAVSNFGLAGSKPVFAHGSYWLHTGESFDQLCFYISCLCLCMRSRRGSIVRVWAAILSCLRCSGCEPRGLIQHGPA